MGKRTVIICIILALAGTAVLLATIGLATSLDRRSREKARNRRFYERLYCDFLSQLEHRDRIDDAVEYGREKAENTSRYQELKGEPQVVWGTITVPAGKDLGPRLRMTLRKKASKKPSYSAPNRTVADGQLHFAFSVAEPREYELLLFETSACPGVRLENVTVKEGQPIPEIILNIEDAAVEVTVRDAKGHAVVGGQVTVGKSGGGSNTSLFTWRRGLTDSNGNFLAENLTDGEYVVTVQTQQRNGATSISVARNEYREVNVTLSHDNY
jgi:hypothetical protein